jgi:hypothetical protein
MRNLLAVFLLMVPAWWAQDKPTNTQVSMPSKEELSELLNKADEKISSFEEAVRNAEPSLDKVNSKLVAKDLDAASSAHALIVAMQKNGASAYGLVGLLATLDDLSLDAAIDSIQLLRVDEEKVAKGKQPDVGALSSVILLNGAATACNDIAELIMHATLRYVSVEEQALGKLLDSKK